MTTTRSTRSTRSTRGAAASPAIANVRQTSTRKRPSTRSAAQPTYSKAHKSAFGPAYRPTIRRKFLEAGLAVVAVIVVSVIAFNILTSSEPNTAANDPAPVENAGNTSTNTGILRGSDGEE